MAAPVEEFEALLARMEALAEELEAPLRCTTPAYGAPGHAHCAACCYGTGFATSCNEEELDVEAAQALRRAVSAWRAAEIVPFVTS